MTSLPLFDAPSPAPAPQPPAAPTAIRLRDYQTQAIDAVFEAWQEHQRALLVMATGLGKTITFAEIASRVKGRVMVLAHREELIHQAVKKIEQVTGERPDIEMAGYWADEMPSRRTRVVVSSIQTQVAGQNGGRMSRFNLADFDLVVVDEAHHSTADTYRRVIDHYLKSPDTRLLGVTATPDRADEAALGQIFECVPYVYEINHGISDGYLVPIRQRMVEVEDLDFSQVRTTAGDLNGRDLAAIMEALEYEQKEGFHGIARPTLEIAGDRKTLIFATSVAHAEMLCEVFNRYKPDSARWVCGTTPKDERKQIIRDYAASRFQFLCNVGVFTEGFDEPSVEVVAIARPTESRALYTQMVGRGTRTLPGVIEGIISPGERLAAIAASSKPSVEVLDFVGNSGQHKLITTADILGGDYDDSVVRLAEEIVRERSEGDAPDMREALAEAENRVHEERKRQAEAEKRRQIQGRAKYNTRFVDPFDVLDIEPPRERGWDRGRKPTEKMVAAIDKMTKGKVDASDMSFAQAKQLIGKLIDRSKHGWCTFPQATLLKKYGYDPKGVRFEQASELITRIKDNGWRQPDPMPETEGV